jgi:predicted ATP-dependent serine protease
VLYVTGEESAEQIALRAERLGLVNAPIEILAEVQLEAVVAAIDTAAPEIVVVDSIQTRLHRGAHQRARAASRRCASARRSSRAWPSSAASSSCSSAT